jgi:hypothetical protein
MMQLPEPGVDWYVPAGHGVQLAEPMKLKRPATHVWQTVPFVGTNVPTGQMVVVDVAAPHKIPGSHSLHLVMPVETWYVPAAHAKQSRIPVTGPKRPAGHAVHATPPRLWWKPTGHGSHAVAPVNIEKLPKPHATHTELPALAANVPAAHGVHALRVVVDANVPGRHLVHADAAAGAYSPARQATCVTVAGPVQR